MEEKTIKGVFSDTALRFQDKDAILEKKGNQWIGTTYKELLDSVQDLGTGLINLGMEKGDRVAILTPNCSQWVQSYLAIVTNNSIAVPIDKELKAQELSYILEDSGAKFIILTQEYLEKIKEISDTLPQFNSSANAGGKLILIKDESTDVYRPEEIGGLVYFDELFGHTEFKEREMGFADTVAILYTSGTTGRPKGVMLTNQNILTNYYGVKELMEIDDKIRTLSFLPISHVYESTCGVLLPLFLGGTVAFAESLLKVAQNLQEIKPNFFLGVPALYQALYTRMFQKVNANPIGRLLNSNPVTRKIIQKKVKSELGGSNITFISGGASFDPSLQEGLRRLGLNIYNGYGITETAPLVAVNSKVGGDRLGSVGKVMPEVDVKINQPNDYNIGEIWIKGPNVMKGYFNNPDATSEALTEGWYHSGDLGYLDEENFLFIMGRAKNLIVTGKGKNIYPEEVEAELLKSPYIEETMVYAHKPGTTDEEVRAVVYLNPEAMDNYAKELTDKEGVKGPTKKDIEDLIRTEIREYCAKLADYKKVKDFIIRDDEFPKTSSRKIKRYAVDKK